VIFRLKALLPVNMEVCVYISTRLWG